ncbi:MAG TPA: YbaB/EbfC family nucleoid-associated protein [Pseudonocardiaceae bacterium]|jgi:DNA-binding protein YbaB|nr:YbaB/EbfC family nucleoid-associated protein [Pseudonocardiaceae bacterium]
MTNHRDEVDQLMAEYRRSREQLAAVHRTLLSITESASSPDGLVRASVDSAGTLSGLTIDDEAYHRYRPAELADVVVRAARAAAVKAGERARQAMVPVLPADVDPDAVLTGRADLTPDEIGSPPTPATGVPVVAPAPASVPRAPRQRVDDDESYEETTWMNRAGRGR